MLSRHRTPRGPRLRHRHGSAALQICRPSNSLAKRRAAITATRWPRSPTQKGQWWQWQSTWPSVSRCTDSASPRPSFTPPIHKERFGPFAALVFQKQLCSVFQCLFSCDIDRRRTRGRKKRENANVKKEKTRKCCVFFVSTWALLYVGWVSASSRSRLRSLACELLRIWKERQQTVFLCFWEASAYLTAVHIGVRVGGFRGRWGDV